MRERLRQIFAAMLTATGSPGVPSAPPAADKQRSNFGPYELVDLIGEGATGQVYRAIDTRLERTVALKLLHNSRSDRFQREAQAIAALNHPNICTLYDIGPNYLVMEFVDGAPLRGPFPTSHALKLALELAGALAAGLDTGIILRDL
jgi:serine/threonine protein kinase